MEEKRIVDYIQGRPVPETELAELLDWIEASDENQKRYNELKKLWVLTGLSKVNEENPQKFFAQSKRSKTVIFNFSQPWLKYAAIFLLAFITGAVSISFFKQNNSNLYTDVYNEIHVPNGEKSQITLYDGTQVWLNSGTTLRYPVVFNGGERNVYIDGEAFFDVAKDKKNPFFVNASDMKVKVLGTRFNVYAYHEEQILHTTLEEGLVDISISGSNKIISLNPGDQIAFAKDSRTYELQQVDTDLYTSWKENMLRFENSELGEILKKMERWYDVKMKIDQRMDTSERYTFTIHTESLREMLEALSITSNINYEIENEIVRITKK